MITKRFNQMGEFKLMVMFYIRRFPRLNYTFSDIELSNFFKSFSRNKRRLSIDKRYLPQVQEALDTGNPDTLIHIVDKLNPYILDWIEAGGDGENNEIFILLPWYALVAIVICLNILYN